MTRQSGILLVILFLITSFFYTTNLNTVPGSLHNDEVANTYAGRFIFQNGKDLFGNRFPLMYMDKFGDYPPVLPMYISALGTYIFGINGFGSRFGIAIVGALSIIPFFLLAYGIYKKIKVAFTLTLLYSFLPWNFVLARSNAEGIVGLTVYMFGLLCTFLHIRNKGITYALLGIIFFTLTLFLYPSYRLFTPLTLLTLFIYSMVIKQKEGATSTLIMLIIIATITGAIALSPWGKGRFNQTSLFTDLSGVNIKIQELTFNENNRYIARLFNNKIIGYGHKFLEQYFEYFSPQFLFMKGGYAFVYAVPYTGLLFISLLYPVVLYFFKKKDVEYDRIAYALILTLLALAPIPAALTIVETPNIHRSLQMSIFFLLALGPALLSLYEQKNRMFLYVFFIFFLLENVFFLHNYFQQAPFVQSMYRNDGNSKLATYLFEAKKKYRKIYVTNREAWLPVTYLLFTNDFDSKYVGQFKQNFRLSNVGSITFPESDCLTDMLSNNKKGNVLYVLPADCPIDISRYQVANTIYRLNNTPVFKAYVFSPTP